MAVSSLPLQYSFVLRTIFAGLVIAVIHKVVSKILEIRRTYAHYKDFPGQDEFSWITGTMHHIPSNGEERAQFTLNKMKQCGTMAMMWAGPIRPQVLLFHPKTVKEIFKSSAAPKSRGFGGAYTFILPWIGEGLIASNGHTWARSRRLLTPAFHFDILKSYIIQFNKAADTLIKKLDVYAESGEKFDFYPLVTLCTLEAILKCAMGYEDNVQGSDDHPYAMAIREIVGLVSERGRTVRYWPDFIYRRTESGHRFYKHCDYVHGVAEKVIKQRKEALAREGAPTSKHLDFLDILLTARDEDGQPMTDLEIRNEVDTFMFAGHDTTAAGAPWILHTLAQHPDYLAKVQEELDDVMEGKDTLDWSDMAKLPTLALCTKEAFRLFPPVPGIQRVMTEDIQLDGRTVKEGTLVVLNFLAMHRNPKVWDKPDEYNPERFKPENMKDQDSFAYTPFSAGSRNCIGQNFALTEEKVVIGRLLHRYHVEVAKDGPPMSRLPMAVMRAEHGLWFRIKKRQI